MGNAPRSQSDRHTPVTEQPDGRSDKAEEVGFLAETFEIPAAGAAALVAEGDAAEALTEAELRRERDVDELADAPVPEEPAAEIAMDNDEERLKPVVHRRPTPS